MALSSARLQFEDLPRSGRIKAASDAASSLKTYPGLRLRRSRREWYLAEVMCVVCMRDKPGGCAACVDCVDCIDC